MKRIFLTIAFVLYVVLILFLSFQPGGDTADTGMRFTNFILGLFIEGDIPYETLVRWHMTFRLWVHPVIFCCYGVFAMGVTTEFIKKRWVCVLLTSISGILLAVLTEVGKWNIPGRHFDREEMMLNVVGVIAGVLVYVVIAKMQVKKADKSPFRAFGAL